MSADEIEAAAAAWLIANDEPELPAERQAEFERWLAADPRHEVAYVRLSTAWRRSSRLRALRPPPGPIDPDLRLLETARPKQLWCSRWLTSIAAATVLVVVGGIVGTIFVRANAWHDYATDAGEFQRIVLADQSIVRLNTASKIRVRLTPEKREVQLVRGEANFQVAHDAGRPFDVTAGRTTVRAIGTEFTVRRRGDDRLDVIVTEGRVAIDATSAAPLPIPFPVEQGMERSKAAGEKPKTHARMLAAGEMASVAGGRLTVRPMTSDAVKQASSWMEGRLWFERAPLTAVAAEFNRYNKRQIEIGDPAIGALKVGGGFEATDPESFLAALQRTLPVRVDDSDPDVYRIYGDEH